MSDRHGVQPALSHDASGITSDSRRPASGPDRASQTVSGALEEQERKPVRCKRCSTYFLPLTSLTEPFLAPIKPDPD